MPKFTRRHHNAVADLFWIRQQELLSLGKPQAYREEWYTLQQRFCRLFAGDNAAFKPSKFDRACGIPGRIISVEEVDSE